MSVTIVASGGNVGVATSSSSATVSTSNNVADNTSWDNLVGLLGRGYNYPPPTGQTTVYRTGDDADIEATIFAPVRAANSLKANNGLVDHYTLTNTNSFGNTDRFTDENGLQVYGGDYAIDHLTGLGWQLTAQNNINWDDAIDYATGATINGFSDWFVPNMHILHLIKDSNQGATFQIITPPFPSITNGQRVYSSSSGRGGSGAPFQKSYISWRSEISDSFSASIVGASSTSWYFYCRKHF